MIHLEPKVLFILGKGGVGRTTISASLGYFYANQGLKTLVIQWAMRDWVSPLFHCEPAGHKQKEILPNFYVMNYDPEITLKEYFVDHLHLKLFYKFILENQQVKKLLQATPGLEELFFLGRIFWLVELARKERGYEFDKIIIDTPATGHGIALFGVIATISNFTLEGPLISEATRVARLLADPEKVGTIVVTLPEELPYEETIELVHLIQKDMGREPIALFINRSFSYYFSHSSYYSLYKEKYEKEKPDWIQNFGSYQSVMESLYLDIKRKLYYEKKIKEKFVSKISSVISIPDLIIQNAEFNSLEKIQEIENIYKKS